MTAWIWLPLTLGLSMSLWGVIGLLRCLDELLHRVGPGRAPQRSRNRVSTDEVAVMMAAHNEEAVICASLQRLIHLVPAANVFVVSDGSSDRTVELARSSGVTVVETPTNVGKASALAFNRDENHLLDRYRVVMILDADTLLDVDYFDMALPSFDDPRVVAVAGCAHTWWGRPLGLLGNVVVTHRQRVYVLTQLLLKYGQTWRGLNATPIIPGFASLYRTDVLRQIEIDTPGLVIEDFNMTFQVHAKRLGRIAFNPAARAYTQDPATLRDYLHQIRRWDLGFWHTLKRWRPSLTVFTASLVVTIVELVVSSVALLLLPAYVAVGLVGFLPVGVLATFGDLVVLRDLQQPMLTGVTMIVISDYAVTCLMAIRERRPLILVVGLGSLPMRLIDAAMAIRTLPMALSARPTGQWFSPQRRAVTASNAPPHDSAALAPEPERSLA